MNLQLSKFVHSLWYWLAVLITALSLEGIALFYQYGLGEPPCVLCIQARFWVLVGAIFALVGLVLRKSLAGRLIAQGGIIVGLVMLLNRSYIAVLVERGQYEGQCGMDPGFPAWMPLDTWFPQVFEVWTMCGYTPNFLFGLSMGEGLVLGGGILLAIALAATFFMVQPVIKQKLA